jgi:hypothetical protein
LHQRLQFAYRKAAEEAGKSAAKNKRNYDLTVKHSKIEVGDQVLIRKVGLQGTSKLADNWDEEVFIVLSMPNPDIPVYRVQRLDRKGPIKTLHRNMLLPYTSQVTKESVEPPSVGCFRKKPKAPRSEANKSPLSVDNSTSDSSDSSDSEPVPRYVPPHLRRVCNQRPVHRASGPQPSPIGISVPSQVSDATPQLVEVTVPVEHDQLTGSNLHTVDRASRNSIPVTPDNPVKSPRPVRRRAPPDRYGEWVSSIKYL